MHTFLDNSEEDGKYSARVASHQVELRREETFTDQKSLNILSLQTDYLNLDSSSGFYGYSDRAHDVQTDCIFCGGVNHSAEQCLKKVRKEKEKARAVHVSSYRKMELTPRKCFRCGSEDQMIESVQSKYVLMKKVIIHVTTAKMIVTARYMYIWHECLAMTNGTIMVRLNTET